MLVDGLYRRSWPSPLLRTFDLEIILTLSFKWPSQNSRLKVTYKVIVLLYSHLTVHRSWPWPLPWTFDFERIRTLTLKLPSQNSKFRVKGHLKVKCWGHKVIILQAHEVIVLLYSHLTVRRSWPWPLPWTFNLEKILTLTFKFYLAMILILTFKWPL